MDNQSNQENFNFDESDPQNGDDRLNFKVMNLDYNYE